MDIPGSIAAGSPTGGEESGPGSRAPATRPADNLDPIRSAGTLVRAMKWDPHIHAPGVDSFEFAAMTPIYEQALIRDPDDIGTISWLAHAYTRIGRISDGLELDIRLTTLLPDDPTVRYNLGCSYAMLGRIEDALAALEEAIDLGYRDAGLMREDEDLASLRSDSRFRMLLERI